MNKAPQHDPQNYSRDDSGKVRNFDAGSVNASNHSKTPPQALEMEESVLGALILEKDALHKILDLLKPEMFYRKRNGLIFDSILGLFRDSEPVDLFTVKEALTRVGQLDEVGGLPYLAELSQRVASAANIGFHARVVVEMYIKRKLIVISDEVVQKAYDPTVDVFDLLDEAEQNLFQISETNLRKNYEGIGDLLPKTMEILEQLRASGSKITGIPSGFKELDQITAGWQPSDLVILAARPGMGKTAFALNIARNAAIQSGVPVALFSLEMASIQLTQRLISCEAELDSQDLRTGKISDEDWPKLMSRMAKLSKANLYIDDTPALSIMDLRAKCRRLKSEKKIQMVIIDYLQLMSGPTFKSGNREQEIAAISRGLKELAKELDVCVIALAQLSRAVETRGGIKRPMLSDLRESGSIEQDADMVGFFYRPEYYGLETDDDGNSSAGLAELIIAKQRNGPTGSVKLQFIKSYGKFTDWSGNAAQQMGEAYRDFGAGGQQSNYTIPSAMNDDADSDNPPPALPPTKGPGSGDVPF